MTKSCFTKSCFVKSNYALCAAILIAVFFIGAPKAWAADGFKDIASSSDLAESQQTLLYGMTPIYAQDIADGEYTVEVECSSKFFNIEQADLTVKDGKMTAVLHMSSNSYSHVYLGTPEEAAEADLDDYIALEKKNYESSFTIPVEAFNKAIDLAAFSKDRQKWYPRTIVFDASSLPSEALDYTVPDYNRIELAIDAYDEENGTDTRAETYGEETESAAPLSDQPSDPVDMEVDDGEYSIEVDMTGGSGRASITTPTWLYVKDGKGYARLLWSSVYYDYMIVGGKTYTNETTDGGNSTFTIPITALDEPMTVIADTTAMGDPVEIEYTLTFYGDSIGRKGRVPQEAAKSVVLVALVLIVGGGVANHFVKKRRRQGGSR